MDIPIEAAWTIGITAGALVLFVMNRFPVEVVGMLVLAMLVLTGLVTPREGLSGFSNEATVTVAFMLVLSIGLLRTGAVDVVASWVGRTAGDSEARLLLVVVLLVIPISAFLNNTAVVAILVPTVLGLARQMGAAPSRILMPLSFASQMGGTLTLVGTSTNLLVAGILLDMGMDRIQLFDITPPALVLTGAGVVYLMTVGRWLMPRRESQQDLLAQYELRDYLTGLVVDPGSPLVGQSLAESRFGEEFGLSVLVIERRDGGRIRYPRGSTVLHDHDLLLVQGKIPDIAQVEEVEGLRIAGNPPLLSGPGETESDEEAGLAEVIVPPTSHLIGRTLKEIGFRSRFGLSVLAVRRHGHAIRDRIGEFRVESGDILLVQGPTRAMRELHEGRELSLLGPVDLPVKRRTKRRLSVAIMVGVVLVPALGIAPILISSLVGVALMFATRCVTPAEVYDEMDWSVLVLLGSILPLGIAMQKSGAAELMASTLLRLTEPWGVHGTLAVFYVLTLGLTAVISNAAAAVVLTPMAVATAISLEVSPLPFVIAVMIAASNSYITPIGYQTNLFIYGPGGYHFSDFARVGGPLTVISIIVATLVIPVFFPF